MTACETSDTRRWIGNMKTKKTKKTKYIICAAAVVLLFLTACGGGATKDSDGSGSPGDTVTGDFGATQDSDKSRITDCFDSPEDVVTAFFEAFRDSDISRMIDTFATDKYVEGFDFEASLVWSGAFDTQAMPLQTNKFSVSISVEKYRGEAANMITGLFNALCTFESGQEAPPPNQSLDNDNDVHALMDRLYTTANAPKLDTLEVLGFITTETLSHLAEIIGVSDFSGRYYDESMMRAVSEAAKKKSTGRIRPQTVSQFLRSTETGIYKALKSMNTAVIGE